VSLAGDPGRSLLGSSFYREFGVKGAVAFDEGVFFFAAKSWILFNNSVLGLQILPLARRPPKEKNRRLFSWRRFLSFLETRDDWRETDQKLEGEKTSTSGEVSSIRVYIAGNRRKKENRACLVSVSSMSHY
jgi:hypothetical protein